MPGVTPFQSAIPHTTTELVPVVVTVVELAVLVVALPTAGVAASLALLHRDTVIECQQLPPLTGTVTVIDADVAIVVVQE